MSELNSVIEEGLVASPASSSLLNREQVAGRYQVSVRTITKWMRQRVIPFIRIGHVIRYDAAACDAALRAREIKSPFVTERSAVR